jgi:hypothetical protein
MSPQATGEEERQEHIRPNFGGIAIEDVRLEYLGDEDEVFCSTRSLKRRPDYNPFELLYNPNHAKSTFFFY